MSNPHLVSTEWLEAHLSAPDIVVVDASWYLPAQNRSGLDEYESGHLPGAVFFDLDAISDRSSSLPHMLPGPDEFARAVGALGIGDGKRIVVYDGAGMFSAPRVWWTLRTFGAGDVVILDGGAPKWRKEGRPWTDEPSRIRSAVFTPRLNHGAVASLRDIRTALGNGTQVVDARSTERFRGEAPEPRPGLPSGHMPGALNVPAGSLIADGRLKSPDAIAAAFAAGGVDPSRAVITTCGSGVTAAILTLALESLGRPAKALYDGSWTEWASDPTCPIATGVD